MSVHTPSGVSPQSLAVVNVQSSRPSVALYMMVGETETIICERPGLMATSQSTAHDYILPTQYSNPLCM